MADIVTIDALEVGAILGSVWIARGGHHLSSAPVDIADSSVVLFGGSPETIGELAGALAGKVLIDCGRATEEDEWRSSSRTERIARALPRTPVVKAFCNPSAEVLRLVVKHGGPEIGSVFVSGLFCGDHADAKEIVRGLIGETNLDPIDCGDLSQSSMLDAVSLLEKRLDSRYAITSVGTKRESSPADRFF